MLSSVLIIVGARLFASSVVTLRIVAAAPFNVNVLVELHLDLVVVDDAVV